MIIFQPIVTIILLLKLYFSDCSTERNVKVKGKHFIESETGVEIILTGPNIVVKGPPYLPFVSGSDACNDIVDDTCSNFGNCTSCYTFNEADIKNIQKNGWNTIRLGVVWAGAQPEDDNKLDENFLSRLHSLLNLTDFYKIHVVLDNHGDMTGSLGCGNGAPYWVQKEAAGDLVGKPLETSFPYNIFIDVKKLGGYSYCGDNTTKWAQFAGDPNYNLLNECCQLLNSNNPGELGFTTISQKTMNYIISKGEGRKKFVRFWRLMAEAVKYHPSAIMAELMNEPMTLWRNDLYETWRECGQAINQIIPDMMIVISDNFQGSILPWWLTWVSPYFDISRETANWIKESNNLVYGFHWYGFPKEPQDAIKNVLAIQNAWNLPVFATEFMDCKFWELAKNANISTTYWHYSSYCNTGPIFGNRKVPQNTFGACILGWGSGISKNYCK